MVFKKYPEVTRIEDENQAQKTELLLRTSEGLVVLSADTYLAGVPDDKLTIAIKPEKAEEIAQALKHYAQKAREKK